MKISELISKMAASTDKGDVEQLETMFLESVFGLFMNGLPKREHEQGFVVDSSRRVTMQFVNGPDDRKMIKACADPEQFDINYPGCINVTMNGKALLEMAEKVSDADGILICSATSFHSYPIYKADYQRLKVLKPIGALRKWWQFWKPA